MVSDLPEKSFYWFDYETFGTHPAWDRPCQFAGLRTDEDLNVIGEPLVIFCKQTMDYLPHPAACKVTGISPQRANADGVNESTFIDTIISQIGKPGTCSVGYNSIRFDDEFTRHALFRNFHDPYEYEWKDGNSRWDLLDVVRLTRALRPNGVTWPVREDGTISNRLEDLSKANGIDHDHAHDALSDVYATIGMARLIKRAQPNLFDYAFANRGKQAVASRLNVQEQAPCVQISGMISANRQHVGIILPLSRHPARPNSVIVLDLHQNPTDLLTMPAERIEELLFQKGEASDAPRPGLRTVQINKCPVLAPMNTLRKQDALRLEIDLDEIQHHLCIARGLYDPQINQRIVKAMTFTPQDPVADIDGSLYSGGFLNNNDRQRLEQVRLAEPSHILDIAAHFDDMRLKELAWRYLARNYPESLDVEQSALWRDFCLERLETQGAPWLSFDDYRREVDEVPWVETERALRQALINYGQSLLDH